jgi:hypothetical protein
VAGFDIFRGFSISAIGIFGIDGVHVKIHFGFQSRFSMMRSIIGLKASVMGVPD